MVTFFAFYTYFSCKNMLYTRKKQKKSRKNCDSVSLARTNITVCPMTAGIILLLLREGAERR